MPTYEYSCKSCSSEFEAEQRITADPLANCPHCGAPSPTRLVGTGNFILKGSGWYSDLYSGGGSSAKSGSDTGASASSSTPAASGGCGSCADGAPACAKPD